MVKAAEIYADGTLWEDSDGRTAWDAMEAAALAESLERRGYTVELAYFDWYPTDGPDGYGENYQGGPCGDH